MAKRYNGQWFKEHLNGKVFTRRLEANGRVTVWQGDEEDPELIDPELIAELIQDGYLTREWSDERWIMSDQGIDEWHHVMREKRIEALRDELARLEAQNGR